ncbi:MAG: glyoxalase superfamily protein [Rhodospirillales bacterium]
MLLQAIPILRIFDEAAAKAFYLDFLGFALDWEHRFEPDLPLYCQVSRDSLKLHLSGHHGDCTPGSTVFIAVQDLEAYHAEVSAKGYAFNRPGLEPAPWGGSVMEATDPFANRLRFWEDD